MPDRLKPGGEPVAILFVTPGGAGGAEVALRWLIDALGAQWVKRVVLIHGGPFEQQLRERGHPVEVLPPGRAPASVRRLRRIIRSERPELVQANGFKAAALAGLAALGTGVPVLWTKVDLARDGAAALVVGVLCQQVIAVSEAAAATFGRRLRGRISVVPNGIPEQPVDRTAGRAALVSMLKCAREAPVVVLSGRLYPGKGQLELVETAPLLLEARPDLRIALLGGPDRFHPEYEHELRARAVELGVAPAVTFLGHRDDAAALVGGADVLVAPSVRQRRGGWQEGFGLVVAEAFWAGTPVVVYRSGSLPEVLGECGRVVEEGDRAGLAAAVISLLDDEGERQRLAECGRRRVRARYTLRTYVGRMRQRYAAALAGGRRRPGWIDRPASGEA